MLLATPINMGSSTTTSVVLERKVLAFLWSTIFSILARFIDSSARPPAASELKIFLLDSGRKQTLESRLWMFSVNLVHLWLRAKRFYLCFTFPALMGFIGDSKCFFVDINFRFLTFLFIYSFILTGTMLINQQ